MACLLFDADSLGYDLRDFESVLDFAERHPGEQLVVVTRASNIELFSTSLCGSHVTYVGYSKYAGRPDPQEVARSLGISSPRMLSFAETHSFVEGRNKGAAAVPLPNGRSYLRAPEALVERFVQQLRALAASAHPLRPCFAIVSGLKPYSDVGETAAQHIEEGRRQTFPLERVFAVTKHVQEALAPNGGMLLPLCVQYGPRSEVRAHVERLNDEFRLSNPVGIFEDVDWDSQVHQHVAFYQALRQTGIPVISYGNASTYLHAILGSVGTFDAMAVALHGYPAANARDGRGYWIEAALALPSLATFQQSIPGEWLDVSSQMASWLTAQCVERMANRRT